MIRSPATAYRRASAGGRIRPGRCECVPWALAPDPPSRHVRGYEAGL